MEPNKIPRSLSLPVELAEFRVNGGEEVADRAELLRRLRAGEVFTLTVTAKTYLQPKVDLPLKKSQRARANASLARFRDEDLPAFAKSFTGKLFLRDHNRWSMGAVGGRIVSSDLVDDDKGYAFLQKLELVKTWAIEDALDGTMQTFSIGWDPKKAGWEGYKASLLCSVCNGPFWGKDGCGHSVGQEVAGNFAEPVIVEALWVNVIGAETSEVAFPAVRGTGVEEIHAALSEARSLWPTPTTKDDRMDEILKALGLNEAADAKAAIAEIGKLAARATAAEARLDEERKARAAEAEDLGRVRAELAEVKKSTRDADVKRLHEGALAKMLFAAGSKREEYFLAVAARDLKEAESYLGTLEPVVLGAGEMQSTRVAEPTKSDAALSDRQKKMIADMGMTEEQYRSNLAKGGLV